MQSLFTDLPTLMNHAIGDYQSSEERIGSSEETILSRWIGSSRTYNSYLKRDENKIPLYSSRKPHVIFKDASGNLHTIQKETLTVPILGSILPISALFTFLIRYHDVQLTSYNNQTGDHQVLKQNPFGWRNAIRTINVAFGAWFLLMLYSKFNQ